MNEVDPGQTPRQTVYVDVEGSRDWPLPEGIGGAGSWEDTHWGTRVLSARDPDSREVVLQDEGP